MVSVDGAGFDCGRGPAGRGEFAVEEQALERGIAEEMVKGWSVIGTGGGFIIQTDWRWPHGERIEITVRRVSERDDLYLVTDGGELCASLFAQGVRLQEDETASRLLKELLDGSGAVLADFQVVRGATAGQLPGVIRNLLEAVKEAAFRAWQAFDLPVAVKREG